MAEPLTASIKITGMVASASDVKEANENLKDYLRKVFKNNVAGVYDVKVEELYAKFPTLEEGGPLVHTDINPARQQQQEEEKTDDENNT